VVIAIIAILAAILFPVFAKARERARRIQCLSNLKNIATALHMYCGDHDGVFPMATGTYENFWDNPPPDIESGLLPYVGNAWAIFRCPTDNVSRTRADGVKFHACTYAFARAPEPGGRYGYCWHCGQADQDLDNSSNVDDLIRPSEIIVCNELMDSFLLDRQGDFDGGLASLATVEAVMFNGPTEFWRESNYPADPVRAYQIYRHGDTTNLAFGDGHAKAVHKDLHCTGTSAWSSNRLCYEMEGMYSFMNVEPNLSPE